MSRQDSTRRNSGAVVSSSIVDFFRPVTPSLIIPRHVEGATRSLAEIDDMHFAILASSQSSHLGLTSIVLPVGVRSSADYPPRPGLWRRPIWGGPVRGGVALFSDSFPPRVSYVIWGFALWFMGGLCLEVAIFFNTIIIGFL